MSSLLFWTETHGHVHLRSQGFTVPPCGSEKSNAGTAVRGTIIEQQVG